MTGCSSYSSRFDASKKRTMLAEEKLRELLARWQELLREGQNVAAEELCAEQGVEASPELIFELERYMNEVGIMDRLTTEHDVGADTEAD